MDVPPTSVKHPGATHGITGKPKHVVVARNDEPPICIQRPDLQIIDEALWRRVQARFAANAKHAPAKGNYHRGRAYHLLTGSTCARCGGHKITIANTKTRGGERVQAYVCANHVKRGTCDVTIRQPKSIVERAVLSHLLENVLTPEVMSDITARVVELAQQERGDDAVPVERLEKELEQVRKEQRKYAAAVAKAPDVTTLLDELRRGQERITSLERAIAAAKAAPVAAQMTLDTIAREIAATFDRLRHGLVGALEEARAALRTLFPGGLYFEPEGTRWAISGAPRIETPETPRNCDPTGTRTRDCGVRGRRPNR